MLLPIRPLVHPEPNRPPDSYAIHGGRAILFRYVSLAEYNDWQECGILRGPLHGEGIALGKHFTTTIGLARSFGKKFCESEWEHGVGEVLEVRVPVEIALHFDYLGPNVDRVGPVYFGAYEFLYDAIVRKVA